MFYVCITLEECLKYYKIVRFIMTGCHRESYESKISEEKGSRTVGRIDQISLVSCPDQRSQLQGKNSLP